MNVALALYVLCSLLYFIWISRWVYSREGEERLRDLLSECPDSLLGFGIFVLVVVMGFLAVAWPLCLVYDLWHAAREDFGHGSDN